MYLYYYAAFTYFIHVYVHIINLCLSSGNFPTRFKSAVVKPLIKKPTLDCEVLKNYLPISNLPFLPKLIEKVIAKRLVSHMQDNGMVEKFQSAYKANHSTETALLRVYNDMLISIDQGGGATLDSQPLIQLIMKYYLIYGKIPLEYQDQHYLY